MASLILFLISFCAIISCSPKKHLDTRPNILLIVADDLGYSDLGSYGGNIRTPNIDQLAKNGLRFSQFRTGPTCAVTRAMLLSGHNNHVAGMGMQDGLLTDSPRIGKTGYESHLSDRIIPASQLLNESGYHTYTTGKWHLGKREEDSPKAKGFERSYTLLQGGSNHFNNIGIEPADTLSLFREDGKLVDFPTGQYSTEVYTNKLIEFIKEGTTEKSRHPFFALAAYTSPHWPLQVPGNYLDRYAGDFDIGYDSLRVLRFELLREKGLIPPTATLPPRLEHITPWKDLLVEEKKIEARKMELYAAMVDNLDYHVGRIIQFLKVEDLYDNTIIIFMSDNGAAGNDFYNEEWSMDFIRKYYNNNYDNMGKVNSFVSYGPQWAHAGAAPFNRFKGYTTEGGIASPIIITSKNITNPGTINNGYFTVMDLAPTFYELAGATYPGKTGTARTKPLLGKSILPLLQGEDEIHVTDYITALEHRGRMFIRKGNWKLVNLQPPYDESKMMLFNLEEDLGETKDLSRTQPEKFEELLEAWRDYRDANNIIIQ
ncbi:MAG: arylsulfatase [Cyclobacteriaceae bacterium]